MVVYWASRRSNVSSLVLGVLFDLHLVLTAKSFMAAVIVGNFRVKMEIYLPVHLDLVQSAGAATPLSAIWGGR